MSELSIAIIINPRSGSAGGDAAAQQRVAQAKAFLASRGGDPSLVFLTERPGHGRELALAAVARGIATVVAWGGDGTMNEVASGLAFTSTALAIVPGGSGNGLARELKIPFHPTAAFAVAAGAREIVIDAGQVDGRYFFNVAGVGLDARVAHRFATEGGARRGLVRYAELAIREFWGRVPHEVTVTTKGASMTRPVLLVAIANGRQYGNGLLIAPAARLDDGQLDVVVYGPRSVIRACVELPFLFTGHLLRLRGVTSQKVESVEISSSRPLSYHLDGEPFAATCRLEVRVRPRALRVKTPVGS